MNTRTDIELLRDYAELGSEAAFDEVVRRHVDFVYSAALRLVRDSHLAQDVSQAVFLALAQNARQLTNHTVLAGWLHRAAHNLSANAVRSEVRRRSHEQEAAAMNETFAVEPAAVWDSVAPHLDAALGELNEPDRNALLLRYFERKSARDIASTLGISSEAAQKRVNRAVQRLRALFARRGIVLGANALMLLITANAVKAAPTGLAAGVSTAVLSASSVHTSTSIAIAKVIAMTTLQKVIVASAVLLTAGIGIQQANQAARASKQVSTVAQRPAQPAVLARAAETGAAANRSANPAPRRRRVTMPAAGTRTNGTAAVPWLSTEMYAFLTNKVPILTLAQVQPYLDAQGRNAVSLLAAFRTTRDPALLAEAQEKFPGDAQVAFEAAIQNDASPDGRRRWLDGLKKAAPENSLADYLSALAHFKANNATDAVQDLVAAAAKPQFQDYSKERTLSDEAAYLAAGYPPGEAKLLANVFLVKPHLVHVKELGQSLIGLAETYQQAGDQSSRAAALQMAVDLGRRFGDSSTGAEMASQLVGMTIERNALRVMEPASRYGESNQTVQQRLDQLAQQKEAIHVLTAQADPLWKTLPDEGWMDYHTQLAASGEEAALRWLVSNYGQ